MTRNEGLRQLDLIFFSFPRGHTSQSRTVSVTYASPKPLSPCGATLGPFPFTILPARLAGATQRGGPLPDRIGRSIPARRNRNSEIEAVRPVRFRKGSQMECKRPSGVVMVLVLAILILLPHLAAVAQEVVVRNDSVSDFSEAIILPGFVSGEKAAAWLTTPLPGSYRQGADPLASRSLVALEIRLQESIEIFQAGSFPSPG